MALEEHIASLRAELAEMRRLVGAAAVADAGHTDGWHLLLIAWQRLECEPDFAVAILRLLAAKQGLVHDPINGEAPGKLPRVWSARLNPWEPWLAADFSLTAITPLFVAVAVWTIRRLARRELAGEFWPAVKKACRWLVAEINADDEGFLRSPEIQPETLPWGRGRQPARDAANRPALAEVQGYAYAALLLAAEMADNLRQPQEAKMWRQRAAALRRNFNRLFWPANRNLCVPVRLGHRALPAATSAAGLLLFTGILDRRRALGAVRRLLRPDLFASYGLRRLSSKTPGFDVANPSQGAIRTQDNWIFSEGLRILDFKKERQTVKQALLSAEAVLGRLPEGYAVSRDGRVAEMNTTEPTAWTAGLLLNLLDSSLNVKKALDILPCARR